MTTASKARWQSLRGRVRRRRVTTARLKIYNSGCGGVHIDAADGEGSLRTLSLVIPLGLPMRLPALLCAIRTLVEEIVLYRAAHVGESQTDPLELYADIWSAVVPHLFDGAQAAPEQRGALAEALRAWVRALVDIRRRSGRPRSTMASRARLLALLPPPPDFETLERQGPSTCDWPPDLSVVAAVREAHQQGDRVGPGDLTGKQAMRAEIIAVGDGDLTFEDRLHALETALRHLHALTGQAGRPRDDRRNTVVQRLARFAEDHTSTLKEPPGRVFDTICSRITDAAFRTAPSKIGAYKKQRQRLDGTVA